jgi:hypothetical protein
MDLPEHLRGRSLTRRQLMDAFGVVGAGAFLNQAAAAWATGSAGAQLVNRAAATTAAGSDLGAVEHVVFLMMENRSYDHYFGDYPRGRGFNDHPAHSLGVFAQNYPGGSALVPPNKLLPFHLNSTAGMECTDDLTHDWGPQHLCWNHGKMDSWVKVHTSSAYEGANGAMTMGYYQRADLAFYYALADAFTLCDGYHASILGPTHPNRLMANSGTIDPAGRQGGPVTDTSASPDLVWNCTWTTVQELLQDAGVPWKVYSPSNVGVTGKYASLAQYPTSSPALYNPVATPRSWPPPTTCCRISPRFATRSRRSTARRSPRRSPTTSSPTSRRARCPACRGWSRRWGSTSTPPRRRRMGCTSPPWCSTRLLPARQCGQRPRCFSCTTRTTAGSITCLRRRRQRAPPGSPHGHAPLAR